MGKKRGKNGFGDTLPRPLKGMESCDQGRYRDMRLSRTLRVSRVSDEWNEL